MSKKDFTADIAAGFGAFLPDVAAAQPEQTETPAPMKEQGAEIPDETAAAAERPEDGARISAIIKGLARVPKKESSTRRVSLILPPSLVAEMKTVCTEYGLSLNAGATLAFRLFLEEMRAKNDKTV